VHVDARDRCMQPANIARIVVFVKEVGDNPHCAQHTIIYLCLKCTVKYILSSTVSCSRIQKNFSYLGCSIVAEREKERERERERAVSL